MSDTTAAWPAAGSLRRIGAVGFLAVVVLALLLYAQPPWYARFQAFGFDTWQVLYPRQVVSTPTTVVAIDEKSLASLGQWPWPRTRLAELISDIARHRPVAIGIDILMPEPDRLSPERILNRAWARDPVLASRLAELRSNDSVLASAIASAPVVLPIAGTLESTDKLLRIPPFTIIDPHATAVAMPRVPPKILRFAGAYTNLDELDRAAAGHGVIAAEPSNGVIRRIPLVFNINGTLAPALSIEMLRVAIHAPALKLRLAGDSVTGISIGNFLAPTESDGAVRVYFSPWNPRRYVSAIDVLDGSVDPVSLQQKLVLIGTTGLGMVDYQNTPLGERMPGSEIHAQLLENLVDQTLLTRPAWAPFFESAMFVLLALLLAWTTPRWTPRNAALLALGCIALPAFAALFAFRSQRLLFDVATPGASLLVLFAILLLLTLAEATRHRRSLEHVVQAQRERAAHVAGEIEAAQRIQTGLLPHPDLLRSDDRIDLAASMTPAREVGGDLYDFFRLDGDRLLFLIGDVAGKGLSASMFMAVSKALYKSTALRSENATIGELMSAANAEVSRDNSEMYFVTVFAGILDLRSGELVYCNAGHENPYPLRAGSSALDRLEDGGGPPLCVVEGYAYRGARYQMQRGELLCLFTDGVIDAQNPAGRMYGGDRLRAALARIDVAQASAQHVVDTLLADVAAFTAGAEPADDVTVMALRWIGPRLSG